jgi:DNA-binding NarL/FixJ family response regulator
MGRHVEPCQIGTPVAGDGELEILGLLVDGRSNRGIARTLMVAPRTVAAHIEHILVTLVTRTRTRRRCG